MSNELTTDRMNEAIARLVGYEQQEQDFRRPNNTLVFLIDHYWTPVHHLKYHSSWDWLMPVIEKISKMPLLNHDNTPCADPQDACYPCTFGMPTADGKRVMVRFKGFSLHEADTLIEAAHMAVYEVAEYHNKQQSNDTK